MLFILDHGNEVSIGDGDMTPVSGERALSQVEHLVSLGPRSIGSDSIAQAREYIKGQLRVMGLKVRCDPFVATYEGTDYDMENIIGIIPGSGGRGIIAVGGHYDTKDIPGANDGGSSAGLLLELGEVLVEQALEHTVWLIFFDGEDTGDDPETMFYGSRHLVELLEEEESLPSWLIVPDMIGDRKLMIQRDGNSDRELLNYIWAKADEMGYNEHFGQSQIMVLDDHVPFMSAGVPSCVLIDFEYGPLNSYWHTEKDDLDKIDADSLKAVGDVIYGVVMGLDSGDLNSTGS